MKKAHKIRGISLEVCTAEQKLAYELAFTGRSLTAGAEKLVEIFGVSSRFNRETVLEALRAGLDAYRKRPFIACDYREIGEAFPVKGA